MKTNNTPRVRRVALSLGALALAALVAAAPATASACGPYGPMLSEPQLEVLLAASAELTDDSLFIVEHKPARIEGRSASIWVKTAGLDDTTRWRKVSLTQADSGWLVCGPETTSCDANA